MVSYSLTNRAGQYVDFMYNRHSSKVKVSKKVMCHDVMLSSHTSKNTPSDLLARYLSTYLALVHGGHRSLRGIKYSDYVLSIGNTMDATKNPKTHHLFLFDTICRLANVAEMSCDTED